MNIKIELTVTEKVFDKILTELIKNGESKDYKEILNTAISLSKVLRGKKFLVTEYSKEILGARTPQLMKVKGICHLTETISLKKNKPNENRSK